jgi:hypothetical protein
MVMARMNKELALRAAIKGKLVNGPNNGCDDGEGTVEINAT